MSYEVKCTVCGKVPTSLFEYKCAECGSPLDIKVEKAFGEKDIRKNAICLALYPVFPVYKRQKCCVACEGWTPLVKLFGNLYFKIESLNPTGFQG